MAIILPNTSPLMSHLISNEKLVAGFGSGRRVSVEGSTYMKRVKSVLNGLLIATFLLAAANLRAGDKSIPKDVPEPSMAAAWNRRLSAVGFEGLPPSEGVNKLRHDFPEL